MKGPGNRAFHPQVRIGLVESKGDPVYSPKFMDTWLFLHGEELVQGVGKEARVL